MSQHRGACGIALRVNGWFIEADGGSRGNPGPAAYGAVVGKGAEIVRELAGTVGTATNNVAEYSGLVIALQWLASHTDASAQVEVKLDSKLVVEQMSGRWKIKHPDMQKLAIAARRAYPPDLVRYTWVPRERNTRADALVNEALDTDAGDGVVINREPV
jgi:ribonuclease HI